MTVLVAVKCIDGVVVGADSAATSCDGLMNIVQIESNDKIKIFDNNIIVACTGAVGYAQRFHDHIQSAINGGVFKQQNRRECFTNLSRRFLSDLENSMVRVHPQLGIGFGSIVVCVHKDFPYLVEYGTKDFQPEEKDGRLFFVSMGSGQSLADPFLAFVNRILWKGAIPSLEMGRLGVYWALNHAINFAPGGVGGKIRIVTLCKRDGKWIASDESDTDESAQFINELEKKIAIQAHDLVAAASSTPPPTPPSGH